MGILHNLSKPVALSASLLAVLAISAGCSKKANESFKENHRGELTDSDDKREEDQSPEDPYKLELKSGAVVTVTMKSDAFDTYVLAARPDGSEAGQNDDCGDDETTNSCIKFTAMTNGTYTVFANTQDADGRGAYVLDIDVAYPAK